MSAATQIVADLSSTMDEATRYGRVLEALALLVPCDGIALLRLEGEVLVPLSSRGFGPDLLGRRFPVAEHPRFEVILASEQVTHFAADSPLPDPYDGLVDGPHDALEVHDCLGCAVMIQGRAWGVLTLDNLESGRFDAVSVQRVKAFASLAAAAVVVAEQMDLLHQKVAHFQQVGQGDARGELVGVSPPHQALLEEISTVASSDLTVLISGPTGVGKELVAEALHRASTRSERPMVRVNCAALPESLAESELFGHVRGAFSGAVEARRGKFEMAHQGTLFLDEIGELPLSIQPKLLRVLQNGHVQRLGSDREHHVDVRVIVATNRDLAEEVRKGRFRPDLYHRLSVYPLRVPPLSERREDILPIAGYLLQRHRGRFGVRALRLSDDASAALLGYEWPGNVRELEHVLSRAALRSMARRESDESIVTIDVSLLDLEPTPSAKVAIEVSAPAIVQNDVNILNDEASVGARPSLREATDGFQRAQIEASLHRHDGVWASVAKELGVDPANLHRLAKRLGLKG